MARGTGTAKTSANITATIICGTIIPIVFGCLAIMKIVMLPLCGYLREKVQEQEQERRSRSASAGHVEGHVEGLDNPLNLGQNTLRIARSVGGAVHKDGTLPETVAPAAELANSNAAVAQLGPRQYNL